MFMSCIQNQGARKKTRLLELLDCHSYDQGSRFNEALPTPYMVSETVNTYCVVLNLKLY